MRRSLFQPRVRLLANVMVYTLADFVADLGQVPAGVNGYAYAASRARLFVQPPPSLAVARTFLALGVVHALVALASIVLLVVRIRRGGFWLARREASPVGVFLLCVDIMGARADGAASTSSTLHLSPRPRSPCWRRGRCGPCTR